MPTSRTFRAHPAALSEIRKFVMSQASASGMSEETSNDLLLAVSEACANAVVHTTSGEIRISWTLFDGCVEIRIQDQGVFRRRVPMPEIEGAHGHGIPLMMAVMDEVSIREGTPARPGTLVRLVKCREKRLASANS